VLTCDDGNVCTDDSCSPASGCVHTNNTAPCDDVDPGTVRDACSETGKCTGQIVTGNYALLGWPLKSPGHRSVDLSTHVLVRGDVCGENIAVGSSSQIEGDTVASAPAGWAIMLGPGARLGGDIVTGGGRILGIERVGVGGRVDQSGAATEFVECLAARYRANVRRADLTTLEPTPGWALGAIELEARASRRLPSMGRLGSGQSVIEVTDLRLGTSSTLTLVGTGAASTVVVHVRGRMMLGRAARIQTDGMHPKQVIFVVDGSVTLLSNASVAGSVFAAGKVRVSTAGTITGALLGSDIDLAPYATVDLQPFVGW
jgi:cytoskeletal protein CcmA (bactofilin family)